MDRKPIKAIVWDLDGTIIHFNIDFVKARKAALKILRNYGVPEEMLSVKDSIIDNVGKSRDFFRRNDFSESEMQKIITKIDKAVSEIEQEAAKCASIIDGMDDIVKYINSKGIKQAIYTFNTSKNALISLKTVNLEKYFKIVVGRDNVNNPKPHEDHLLTVCRKLGVKPQEILVIGDTYRDIEGALKLNAKSIALITKTSKLFDPSALKKADRVVKEEDLPHKLKETINSFL